MKTLAYCYCLS